MKSLTDSEKIRLAKLRKYSPGVQPLENNLKRIKQSKCKELKKFAIHLANRLDSSERELFELKSEIEQSNQKEFSSELRFRKYIFERSYILRKENKFYQGKKVTWKNSLKFVISEVIQLFPPGSKEFKLLVKWIKEIDSINTDFKSGILKKFAHFLDLKKDK